MAADIEVVECTADDLQAVAVVLEELSTAGTGWVNVDPEAALDPQDLPPPRGFLSYRLGARGPDIPRATWTAPGARTPANVGIHHAAGVRANDQLRDAGRPVPETWRLLQDHPKRGLVLALPTPTGSDALPTHEGTLRWLLAATTILSRVPLTGWWAAEIHR
ncbi:MAG: hypothetical protein H0V33_10710 [Acidimicrobiia bacterium]|jgi:hypothetical protein|nr:hypothetical protein [Acidimicrobiia bacterium]